MPRKLDYSNTIIYHIRNCYTKEVIYVGSSTNFSLRKRRHKYNCNKENSTHHNLPIYRYIRENGEWNSYEVIPIKKLELKNKIELLIEEQKEIDKFDTLRNIYRPYSDEEIKKEQNKEWRKNNKDKTIQYSKKRVETKVLCECE